MKSKLLSMTHWLLPICSVSFPILSSYSLLPYYFTPFCFCTHNFLFTKTILLCFVQWVNTISALWISALHFCPLNLKHNPITLYYIYSLSSLPRNCFLKADFLEKITTQTNNRHGNSPQRYGTLSLPVEQFIEKTYHFVHKLMVYFTYFSKTHQPNESLGEQDRNFTLGFCVCVALNSCGRTGIWTGSWKLFWSKAERANTACGIRIGGCELQSKLQCSKAKFRLKHVLP